jgi:ABC-type thiamin/hydroxymethylpyrimidine transport system permease subunit
MKSKIFTLRELILIALLASLSIATKPFVSWLSNSITASANLPGGLIGGVFYMMWLSLVYRVVEKRFSVLFFCILQALLAVTVTGVFPLRAVTYIPPGIMAELVFYFMQKSNYQTLVNMIAGALANASGAITTYFLFIGRETSPLPILIIISLISGGVSGILTTIIYGRLLPFIQITKPTKVEI